MFNLTTNKIFGILGGVAGVSAASSGIVYLTSGRTKANETTTSVTTENKVNDKLRKVGYLPLKTDGAEIAGLWAAVLKEYGKIRAQENTLEEMKNEQALKDKCKDLLSSEVTEVANYSFAKRFCVKAETIAEMLQRNGYTKLNTTIDNSNREKWQSILNLIKDNAQAKKDINLNLVDNNTGEHLNLLVAACKKFDSENFKTHDDKDFEKHYEESKQWCSSKNP